MIPAAYQMPAAVLLVAGGLLACFAGYRLFRIVLGIYGFVLGALIATSIVGPSDTASMLVAGVVGGVVGALLLIVAYFVGVAFVGAGLGALVAHLGWRMVGGDAPWLVVLALSIAGALVALVLQRYVIVIGTAFGGAWTLVAGVLALRGQRAMAAAAARPDAWLTYPFNPAPGEGWVLVVWLVLGAVGTLVQLKTTSGRSSRRRRR